MEESVQNLLILCCYGGVPYIDYFAALGSGGSGSTPLSGMAHLMDPTDWIATDQSGSTLNKSVHPDLLTAHPHLADLIPRTVNVPLDDCDLFNLTFSSGADARLYRTYHGILSCRCPFGRHGHSCELGAFDIQKPLSTTVKAEAVTTAYAISSNTVDDATSDSPLNSTLRTFLQPSSNRPINSLADKSSTVVEQHRTTKRVHFDSRSTTIKSVKQQRRSVTTGNFEENQKRERTTIKEEKRQHTLTTTVVEQRRPSRTAAGYLVAVNNKLTTTTTKSQPKSVEELDKTTATTPIEGVEEQQAWTALFDQQQRSALPVAKEDSNSTAKTTKTESTTTMPQRPAPSPLDGNFAVTATLIVADALERAAPQSSGNGDARNFAIYMVAFLLLAVAMTCCFAIMRGCFCDCFGGFKNPLATSDRYDEPLDINVLNRCLEAVRAHEENEKNKYLINETQRPLISSVSGGCPPYNPSTGRSATPSTYPDTLFTPSTTDNRIVSIATDRLIQPPSVPPADLVRAHSPPPSYHSLNGSCERLYSNTDEGRQNGGNGTAR